MKTVGIVGGMGPESALDLARKMLEETGATCDQDHVPHIVVNDSRVPDRTGHLLRGGESFVPAIVRMLHQLQAAGADFATICCNTAHAKFDEIQVGSPLRLVHIIEETVAHLLATAPNARIGVLGTEATISLDLYGSKLRKADFHLVETTEAMIHASHAGIYALKEGRLDDMNVSQQAAVMMREAGATHIVMGCTELPLILTPTDGITLVDPTRILARALIREARAVSPT